MAKLEPPGINTKDKQMYIQGCLDAERERALTLALMLIQREGIFTDSLSERGYLAVLCRHINEYGFSAKQLGVSEAHYAMLMEYGGNPPTTIRAGPA